MSTVTVTGKLTDAADVPHGASTTLHVEPVREASGAAGLITDRTIRVPVNPTTGAWSVKLTPSSESGTRYRFIAQWSSDSEVGRAVWFGDRNGVWVPTGGGDIGSIVELPQINGVVYTSPTAPDAGVSAEFQFNTVTGDLFVRSA